MQDRLRRHLAAALLWAAAIPVPAAQAWVSLVGPGGSVSQFRAVGGTPISTFATPPGATDIVLSNDGSQLFVGTTNTRQADIRGGAPTLVAVLDANTGGLVHQYPMPASVVKMVKNATDDRVYASGTAADGTTLLMSLNLSTGATASVPVPDTSAFGLFTIGLSADGLTLFVPTRNTIAFFDAASLVQTGSLPLPSNGIVAPPLATPDGHTLLAASTGMLYAVDLATRTLKGQLGFATSAAAFGDALSPDGKTFYVSAGTLSAIDVESMTIKGTAALGQTNPHRLGLSPDGTTLFATDLTYGTTIVVDAATLAQKRTLRHIAPPWAVAVRPNGNPMFLNENANALVRVDTATPGTLGSFAVGDMPGAALQSQGKLFVPEVANLAVQETPSAPTPSKPIAVNLIVADSAAAVADKVYANEGSLMRVVDARREQVTRTVLLRVPSGGGIGTALAITASGDGTTVLATYAALNFSGGPAGGGLLRYDPATGAQRLMPSYPAFVPAWVVASDRSGQFAYATGFFSSSQLGQWDLSNRSFVRHSTIAGNPSYVALATSADGGMLYAVDEHGKIDFVATATMQLVSSLPVGTRPSGIAISGDGTLALVTDGTSNTVFVVDLVGRALAGTIDVGAPSSGALFLD